MKMNKILYFLMSLVPVIGSPRVSYGDLRESVLSDKVTDLKKEGSKLINKKVKDENAKTIEAESKDNIKKKKNDTKIYIKKKSRLSWDKSKSIMKKAVPYISAFAIGAASLLVGQKLFGNNKDVGGSGGGSGDEFKYVDGYIEIPDEMYNINEKYVPDSSGLINYTGPQASHEGHLKWDTYNCWVLDDLYAHFRPELKSTYEEYASKSVKEIINDLDNLPGNESAVIFVDAYVFCKDMQETLNKLRVFIKNKDTEEAYKLLGEEKYINQSLWRKLKSKHKLDLLTSFYNYRTIYRFHYALSLKNRCRIYIKMINNPNKMVNVYQMNDLCKEGDALPDFYLLSDKDYYIKSDKILCRYFNFVVTHGTLSAMQEFFSNIEDRGGRGGIICTDLFNYGENSSVKTFGFDWKHEGNERIMSFYQNDLKKTIEFLKCEKKDVYTDEQISDLIKYGKRTEKGKIYRLVAIKINTPEFNGHGRVIRLKYDNDLKCCKIVDKECYNNDDVITDIEKGKLFECIFNHMQKWERGDSKPTIEYLYFITEDELKNNLEYYKA